MQTAIGRSGVQGDVLDPERPEQVDDDVRPVSLFGYLPATPRFSASATYVSSTTFVTSRSATFAFVLISACFAALKAATSGCG